MFIFRRNRCSSSPEYAARYKAKNTVVISKQLLETMKASSGGGGNAMGEEVGDMFDVGLGI